MFTLLKTIPFILVHEKNSRRLASWMETVLWSSAVGLAVWGALRIFFSKRADASRGGEEDYSFLGRQFAFVFMVRRFFRRLQTAAIRKRKQEYLASLNAAFHPLVRLPLSPPPPPHPRHRHRQIPVLFTTVLRDNRKGLPKRKRLGCFRCRWWNCWNCCKMRKSPQRLW